MNTPEHTDTAQKDPVYQGLGIRICIALLIVLLAGTTIAGFTLYAASQDDLASENKELLRLIHVSDLASDDREIALEAFKVNPHPVNLETLDGIRNGVINTDSLGVETGVLVWCKADSRNASTVREYDRLELRPVIIRKGGTLVTIPADANYCELRVVSPRPPLASLD